MVANLSVKSILQKSLDDEYQKKRAEIKQEKWCDSLSLKLNNMRGKTMKRKALIGGLAIIALAGLSSFATYSVTNRLK